METIRKEDKSNQKEKKNFYFSPLRQGDKYR